MMYRVVPNNKMPVLMIVTLAILLFQASMPAEAVLSCSTGGEVNVSEYLENPSSRVKGPFEKWMQSEVNAARVLIERHAADFDPERAGNTLDYLTKTIGESRGRLAVTQDPADIDEGFGISRGSGVMTSTFFAPGSSAEQPRSYSQVAYVKQSEIGELLEAIYKTETGSAAEMISLETLGIMRLEGSDEAELSIKTNAIYGGPSLSWDIVWANFFDEDPMTYYLYDKADDGDSSVGIITGDALSSRPDRRERNARIWSRIKLAWSEAIGASNQPVFFRKASDFAWLYAHHQPYARGSASILEVKLWALFASNGYKVELYDKNIDLHALSTMKQEDFNLAPLLGLE